VQRIARSLDALISRLVGRPRLDSTLRGELGVVLVTLLGVAPLLPIVRWRALRTAAARPSRPLETPIE